MNTGASCQFINRKAVKKAASILGMDVATALSVINQGKPLESIDKTLFNKLKKYYKGNELETYRAMAMLQEWALSQGFDLLNWRTQVEQIENFNSENRPVNSIDTATNVIYRVLRANKSFNIIPLHGFQNETTPEYSEILNEFAIKSELNDSKLLDYQKGLQYLADSNGEIYGIAKGKNIYLNNKSTKTIDTPIHEYTHLWAKAMQFNNPKGWESVKSLLKNTEKWQEFSDLIQQQEEIYDENLVASEMLASYSGKINSERLQQLDNSLKSRIIQALEKFWNWIGKSLFKIDHFDSIEEVTDRVVYDLLNLTDLQLPETTDLIVNPEYISNVQDYNMTPNQLIQAISGKNNNPNYIIRNKAFNLLSDRGYSLEYLKSIITTPEDVNLFIAYFNQAKINRNIKDELSPEILSQLYLDAIQAIQYKKYIDSPEYQRYGMSNDKDAFDLATLQLSSELATIKKQINSIKEFPVLADEDSIAQYLPLDTSEKAIVPIPPTRK